MTNSNQDQNDVERAATQELIISIIDKFLRMFFAVGLICAVALVIGFAISALFVEGTYPVDTCPDYPKCSYE